MSFPAAALRLSAGVLVWALHFGVLYGFTALACARGFPGAVPWVAGGATLAALAAIALLFLREIPGRAEFVAWVSVAVAGLALVAVLYQTVPLFLVPVCA